MTETRTKQELRDERGDDLRDQIGGGRFGPPLDHVDNCPGCENQDGFTRHNHELTR